MLVGESCPPVSELLLVSRTHCVSSCEQIVLLSELLISYGFWMSASYRNAPYGYICKLRYTAYLFASCYSLGTAFPMLLCLSRFEQERVNVMSRSSCSSLLHSRSLYGITLCEQVCMPASQAALSFAHPPIVCRYLWVICSS